MYFKKVSVTEKLPPLMKFVTTVDIAGEHRVYRLTEYGWNMRDADSDNSPNNNLEITHWLEEVDLSEMEAYAMAWKRLREKIALCYDNENSDLGTIGEIAASAFGWL